MQKLNPSQKHQLHNQAGVDLQDPFTPSQAFDLHRLNHMVPHKLHLSPRALWSLLVGSASPWQYHRCPQGRATGGDSPKSKQASTVFPQHPGSEHLVSSETHGTSGQFVRWVPVPLTGDVLQQLSPFFFPLCRNMFEAQTSLTPHLKEGDIPPLFPRALYLLCNYSMRLCGY